MRTFLYVAIVFLIGLLVLQGVSAATLTYYDVHGRNLGAPAGTSGAGKNAMNWTTPVDILSIVRYPGTTWTTAKIYNDSHDTQTQCSTAGLGSCTNDSSGYCNFTSPIHLNANQTYTVCADSGGATYNYVFADFAGGTTGNTTLVKYINGWFTNSAATDGRIVNINGVIFNVTTADPGVVSTLTVKVKDVVTDVLISGFCLNATGTNTSQYLCNATGNSISFNTTGTYNITVFNITSGNATPQWFNVTQSNYAFTTDATVTLQTYQGTINLAAYRLFLNTSISQINATNNKVSNATMTGSLTLLSTVGTQNILVNVTGNYTKNVSCTLSSALSSASCNATGIYDDLFTIGATNASNGAGIGSFSASMVNLTIGASVTHSTVTGNVTFQTLQGYNYLFSVNGTALELGNATLRANASTNLYNFTLRTANTFNFTVYNESTNTLITENVTLQIISGDFAQNYTFTGGNITIPLLTPGEYTITYWVDQDVPRNYFYVLTSQSYNHVKLYIIDEAISNLYLPIIINGNTVPVANVTVQLLRDYIISGSTHAYSIVEMARTDTNGQAVLRVVPNIVDYKLIITDGSNTLATTPTKFTANTNTYTFSTEGNPTTSLVGYENIAKSLTFDNSTLTYTFTWSDTQNIVSSGCLKVTKFKNGVQTTPLNGCVAGSSGSITHTINDTNGTSYVATATMLTSTTFSTLSAGSLSADFVTTFASFGLVGFLIVFIIFLTFVFVGGESGIAGALVSGFLAILIAGAFGFIASSWTAVIVPAAIIIGIIIYKLRG